MNLQVEVVTYPCHNKGTCTCAVAVKTGDDVIVVDRCKRPNDRKVKRFDDTGEVFSDSKASADMAPMRIAMYLNGQLTDGADISMIHNYQVLAVSLHPVTLFMACDFLFSENVEFKCVTLNKMSDYCEEQRRQVDAGDALLRCMLLPS